MDVFYRHAKYQGPAHGQHTTGALSLSIVSPVVPKSETSLQWLLQLGFWVHPTMLASHMPYCFITPIVRPSLVTAATRVPDYNYYDNSL